MSEKESRVPRTLSDLHKQEDEEEDIFNVSRRGRTKKVKRLNTLVNKKSN